jgi:MoaA/NifB/PqqE/SkfB family radical SAM enzyme
MTAISQPPELLAARRAIRPENLARPTWTSPEQFFRTIGYVTLKVTNGCNLKCSYCNVDADLPSTPRMSAETFRRVATLLIENSQVQKLGLEFHGGEPLLFPDSWYAETVGFAQELAKKHGKTVTHPMQTNGTRLTEERLNFLTSLGICVGISCDGPPEINNTYRQAGKQVEKAIQLMLSRKKGFGMVLVLSRANCFRMTEVMEYFHGLGVPGFRLNFLQPQGLGLEHTLLSGEEMFSGVKSIFDHMAATDCAVLEDTVKILVSRYAFGRSKNPGLSCWELQCQAGRTYCAVNLHGKDKWYVRCFGCKAHRICSLSCPTSHFNEPKYRDSECEYIRKFYVYLHENPEKVSRVIEGLRRRDPAAFGPPPPTPSENAAPAEDAAPARTA